MMRKTISFLSSLVLLFVVSVGVASAKPRVKTIKITVSKNGYTPERATLKKGQTVKLAFYRADSENCGGEIVFPALNIRRKLPVGKTVVITIKPQDSGTLNFSCGMDMMKGALIVQ